MLSSVGNNSSEQLMTTYAKISKYDSDGTSGLSKSELSSYIEGNSNSDDNAFALSLSQEFDKLDTDRNGELSEEEASYSEYDGSASNSSSSSNLTTESISGTASSDDNIKTQSQNLLTAYLKQYTKSYDKSCDSDDDKKAIIKSLMGKYDTNGDGGLSIDELSSIDTSDSSPESQFADDLKTQFKSLDTNNDGLLSIQEMQKGLMKKQYSAHEISEMSQKLSDSDGNGTSLGTSNSSFVQGLLNKYKENDPLMV